MYETSVEGFYRGVGKANRLEEGGQARSLVNLGLAGEDFDCIR